MRLVARKVAGGMWIVAVGIAPVGMAMAQATTAPPGGAGALAAPAPAAAAPGATGVTAPKPAGAAPRVRKALDPRTIPVLLAQGRAALGAEAFKPARDAYMDVLAIDPKNLAAQADLGYAYLKMEDFPRATKALDAAMAAPQPARSTLLNASAALIRTHNPMRAAKFLRDYMAAHASEADETALNALGTALSQADDQSRNLKFFKDCVAFYDQMNAKLEATRPGEKRWGSQWLPAKEADKKFKEYKDRLAEIDKLQREINDAQAKYDTVEANKNRALSIARRQRQRISTAGFDNEMSQISVAAQRIKDKQDAELKKVERPPFEQAVAIVTPDEVPGAPPGPGAPSLASAGTGKSPGAAASPGATAAPSPKVTVSVNPPSPAAPARSNPPAPAAVAVKPMPAPAPVPAALAKATVTTYGAGFPVAPDLIVTSAAVVDGATGITVQPADGDPMDAKLVATDESSGLALLKIPGRKMAYLPLADSFAGGTFQCVGFPTVSIFDPVAEAITGTAVAPKEGWTVRLNKHPRLGGGPLVAGGKVVGVQLATREAELTSIPAAPLDAIKKLVGDQAGASGNADPAQVTMQVTVTHGK
jgi:Trypsin-like peptidase domain